MSICYRSNENNQSLVRINHLVLSSVKGESYEPKGICFVPEFQREKHKGDERSELKMQLN